MRVRTFHGGGGGVERLTVGGENVSRLKDCGEVFNGQMQASGQMRDLDSNTGMRYAVQANILKEQRAGVVEESWLYGIEPLELPTLGRVSPSPPHMPPFPDHPIP